MKSRASRGVAGGLAVAKWSPMTLLKHLLALVPFAIGAFAGCTTEVPDTPDLDTEAEGESVQALTSCHTERPGICTGYPINAAVECAKRHHARVLSYYRGIAEQQCVRHQNGCNDPCRGLDGCHPIAANCGTSNHSRCTAVDFIDDGYPATRADLEAWGFGHRAGQRTHANHWDYMGGGAEAPAPTSSGGTTASPGGKGTPGTSTPPPSGKGTSGGTGGGAGTCTSSTLGQSVADGTCVQRTDNDGWYVCDGSNPSAWPSVDGPQDARCTACPQLAGGQCDDAGGNGK